jgi:hypothetical protein
MVLDHLHDALLPQGKLVLLVPQGPGLFGSLDRTLGHRQRFTQGAIEQQVRHAGFTLERTMQLNKAGAFFWWISSRLLGVERLGKVFLKLFDKTVWLWRLLDPVLPWNGLSLIVIARKT